MNVGIGRIDHWLAVSPGTLENNSSIAPKVAGKARWPGALATATLLGTLILAPIPMAGNHPLAWLFWATLLGLVAATLFANDANGHVFHVPGLRVVFSLGLLFVSFALFQATPLPILGGGLPVQFPGATANLPSLSISPGGTVLAAIRMSSYLIVFWLALRCGRNPSRGLLMATVIFYAIAGYALLAILSLQVFGDTGIVFEKSVYFGAATGTFINKNSFATFLGMGALLGLALIICPTSRKPRRKTKIHRYTQNLAMLTILIALLLTQSRLGVISTLIASLIIVRPYLPVFPSKHAVAFGLVAFSLALLLLRHTAAAEQLMLSLQTRLELYKQLLPMIWDRPVAGFGFGSFPLAYEIYHAPPVTANFVWDRAHSTYLTLWVEGGLIFGSLPMLAGWVTIRQMRRLLLPPSDRQVLARAGLGVTVLCAIHSLGDFSLEIQANAFLLIALAGLALGPTTRFKDPANEHS